MSSETIVDSWCEDVEALRSCPTTAVTMLPQPNKHPAPASHKLSAKTLTLPAKFRRGKIVICGRVYPVPAYFVEFPLGGGEARPGHPKAIRYFFLALLKVRHSERDVSVT